MGPRWQPNFRTEVEPLECGTPLSKIELSTFTYTHVRFDGPDEHIPALNEVKDIIEKQDFSANVFAVSPEYANWETDEVIKRELYRNLLLSLACIFVTTLVLLANLQASLLVMLCVCCVLIDVLGFMHFWGLTIDVVSSINVIISIGLCIDYSSHIAHTFLSLQGNSRVAAINYKKNLVNIV